MDWDRVHRNFALRIRGRDPIPPGKDEPAPTSWTSLGEAVLFWVLASVMMVLPVCFFVGLAMLAGLEGIGVGVAPEGMSPAVLIACIAIGAFVCATGWTVWSFLTALCDEADHRRELSDH